MGGRTVSLSSSGYAGGIGQGVGSSGSGIAEEPDAGALLIEPPQAGQNGASFGRMLSQKGQRSSGLGGSVGAAAARTGSTFLPQKEQKLLSAFIISPQKGQGLRGASSFAAPREAYPPAAASVLRGAVLSAVPERPP